jgi:hypothetical protein
MTVKCEITVRERSRTRSDRALNKNARIYFSHENESILEGFGNRVARPVDVYRQFLPEVAKALGLPENTKFRWSQYAGCSCPCSPGFICSEVQRKDVYVTLSGAPVTNNDPEALAQAHNRQTQLVTQLSAEAAASTKN